MNLVTDLERLLRQHQITKAKLATIPCVYFVHPAIMGSLQSGDPFFGGIKVLTSLSIEYEAPLAFYNWRAAYLYAAERLLFRPETRAWLKHKTRAVTA